MINFLFYASINCQDATDIISRIERNEVLNRVVKIEVIETVKDSTPQCPWDAND